MKKKWLANLILVLISTLVAFVIVEYVIRFMLFSNSKSFESLRDPSAYAVFLKDEYEDFNNDEYWKLVYKFKNWNGIDNPQPLLGWWGFFNRETLKHVDEDKLQNQRPVLLYGDSFAKCVDSIRCFEDILNSDSTFSSDYYLLNYGVGGFGVDQICLLFEETYDRFENPFVIFSLLTTDMDRSMLQFRDAQKPFFSVNNDQLELKGVPIEQSTNEYIDQNPPKIRSYLVNRFRNSKYYPFKQSHKKYNEYVEKTIVLNELILTRVFSKLKKSGLDYLILLFQPEGHSLRDWRISFLLDICEKYDVPFIYDRDIRNMDTSYVNYDPFRYAIRGDGHPTGYMNELIAIELKQIIMEDNYLESIENYNTRILELTTIKDIEYYKNQIISSSEWLEHVKEKAEKRGITLDSMIYLDAIHLMENE